MTPPPDPTRDQYEAYAKAFDYFNERLFNNALPRCLLNFSRKHRALGFFAPLRWERLDGRTHEISLNPDCLMGPPREVMSTLVHEMVHLWQQEFGKPSRANYHNREFADRMEALGLPTSQTGMPGGPRTGQGMTHYVVEGGPFDVAFHAMPMEYLLPWASGRDRSPKEKSPAVRSKSKFTCPQCQANAWGKPDLKIVCGQCNELFVIESDPALVIDSPTPGEIRHDED